MSKNMQLPKRRASIAQNPAVVCKLFIMQPQMGATGDNMDRQNMGKNMQLPSSLATASIAQNPALVQKPVLMFSSLCGLRWEQLVASAWRSVCDTQTHMILLQT